MPLFSSSSLRYAPELVKFQADPAHGPILGAFTYGPASEHPRNPGLFHYGIHAVEILYALMGPRHRRPRERRRRGDGPLGRRPARHSPRRPHIYRELLKQIVTMFQTGKAPLDIAVMVELVGFIEAAFRSAANHGTAEAVPGG